MQMFSACFGSDKHEALIMGSLQSRTVAPLVQLFGELHVVRFLNASIKRPGSLILPASIARPNCC